MKTEPWQVASLAVLSLVQEVRAARKRGDIEAVRVTEAALLAQSAIATKAYNDHIERMAQARNTPAISFTLVD